jgi:hypothetical protein
MILASLHPWDLEVFCVARRVPRDVVGLVFGFLGARNMRGVWPVAMNGLLHAPVEPQRAATSPSLPGAAPAAPPAQTRLSGYRN